MSSRIKALQGRRRLQIKVNQMQCGRLSQVSGIIIVMLCLVYGWLIPTRCMHRGLVLDTAEGANGKQADESYGEPALFPSLLIRQL